MLSHGGERKNESWLPTKVENVCYVVSLTANDVSGLHVRLISESCRFDSCFADKTRKEWINL